jgi:inositol oxygenase
MCYSRINNNFIFRVKIFILPFICSRYDLYTKSSKIPDIEALWPYYQSLIDKYIPGILDW